MIFGEMGEKLTLWECGGVSDFSHREVRNPIARTTHHPARPSKIENAPPPMIAIGINHRTPPSIPAREKTAANTDPTTTPMIPSLRRYALPLASILHSNTMISGNRFFLNIYPQLLIFV